MIWRAVCKAAVVVMLIFWIAGCDVKPGQPQKRMLKIGEIEAELAEYFEIETRNTLFGFGGAEVILKIPAIAHTYDGQVSVKAELDCMNRKYKVVCRDNKCERYAKNDVEVQKRWVEQTRLSPTYILDEGTFDFQSIWNQYCASAGTK